MTPVNKSSGDGRNPFYFDPVEFERVPMMVALVLAVGFGVAFICVGVLIGMAWS